MNTAIQYFLIGCYLILLITFIGTLVLEWFPKKDKEHLND